MFCLFDIIRSRRAVVAALLFQFLSVSLAADDCSCCNRLYLGGFGGELRSNATKLTQKSTVYFVEAAGGAQYVNAHGKAGSSAAGFGGAQLGYEWAECAYDFGCSGWRLKPAVEGEAYWYSYSRKGNLSNPTNRATEHEFQTSLPMNTGVYVLNGVLSLNHCSQPRLSPYVGAGLGAARLSTSHAVSTQLLPTEAGVNHFNSGRSDAKWAFVAQGKVGIRFHLYECAHLFGEYRFVYVQSKRFNFGATNDPGHASTTPWRVRSRDIWHNAFALGIQFSFYR